MQVDYQPLLESFVEAFGPGEKIHVVRSPGRVNLIGEHTDYNDGFVFPMAIGPQVTFVCRARSDGQVRIRSTVYPDQLVEFSIESAIEKSEPKWANYLRGVAAELKRAGIPLVGMDVQLSNTLPVGGGLSSSAAIEVGTAVCFLELAGLQIDPARLALICQKAEHDYAEVPCGIMDQMIVSSAIKDHATLYDCRSGQKKYVALDAKELRVVVVNSMVKHSLADGEYGRRRQQCEEGVRIIGNGDPNIRALRDVTMEQLQAAREKLSDVVYRRCRHVISENQRTVEAAAALGKRLYEQMGQLMVQSHNSLRDDYQVSVRELDFLVEQAMKIKGVYGARMTGGGFGGCIVALVQPRSVEHLLQSLETEYEANFNRKPVGFVTTATAAASVVQ